MTPAAHDRGTGVTEVDVVVVGFGAAGISAAITAHEAGAEVVVLEKMAADVAGGNTRVAGQVWFSPHDVEEAKVHLRALADGFDLPEAIVDAWAQETARNDAWMTERLRETQATREVRPEDPYGRGIDIGVADWDQEAAAAGVDENAAKYEWPELAGNACGNEYHYIGTSQGFSRLWFTLKAALEQRGIEVLYETRAGELVLDGAGEVVGVRAAGPRGPVELRARRGVVLASGGFENNQEMVREFLRLRHATPWGSPGNTGDGIKMAQKAGADLWHMTNFAGIFGVGAPDLGTGFLGGPQGPSHVVVGDDGGRFIDELGGYRHGKLFLHGTMDLHPARPMHYVFDQKVLDAGPIAMPYTAYAGGWGTSVLGYEWSADNRAELDRGWIVEADALAGLGEQMGIDGAALERTVAAYNASCASGEDAQLGRAPASLVPIEGPPYYGYTWPNLVIYTCGGPRKDEQARVVDPFGRPIPRLYCAGEISSTYSWGMSGGMMIGDALAFGRIAGRNAAALPAPSASRPAVGAPA